MGTLRIGEAQHPGPQFHEWTIGTFNPCGLDNKADVAALITGDFWGVTETHLSQHGVSKFKRGLRCNRSKFHHVVPGKPCPLHSRSEVVGNHSGVLAMSQWPCRALPNSIPSVIYDSARVQVVGVSIYGLWITVGICYGFPKSTSHLHPKFCTEQHLEALIDRVACQAQGPRVIMGDFNWEPHELHQLTRLESLGFQDVQTLANQWWGSPVVPTGKGSRRIDFVYVSPELAGMMKRVEVHHDQWPDHAAVAGVFVSQGFALEQFHWNQPKSAEWPAFSWEVAEFDWTAYPPTEAYARFWNQVETQATNCHLQHGHPAIPTECTGRGQTLETRRVVFSQAPIRKARTGEIDPAYFGESVRYAQQFKQARRLQSLVRALRSGNHKQHIHAPDLWHKIRNASGFPHGFCKWWQEVGSKFRDGPKHLSFLVPSLAVAEIVFASVQDAVKQFEKQLLKARRTSAKEKRLSDLNFVFKDCARDSPNKVEMIVDTRASTIQAVLHDDCSLKVDPPFNMLPGVPVCVKGQQLDIIHHEPDRVWVESVAELQPGDQLLQTKVVADDKGVLEAFRQEWEPRWRRQSSVGPNQWDQIIGFTEATLPKVSWPFRTWDRALFHLAAKCKKRTAATGPDGVSRSDLLQQPDTVLDNLVRQYQTIEQSFQWPQQLATGFVSALEKKPGSLQVESFRPTTIYSILYRIWSSVRASDFLKTFKDIIPSGVRGGIPSRQARSIWYEAAQLLEQSHLGNIAYVGVVADLVKAFNQIPREPLWIALATLGCPDWFVKTWASFVGCQSRRFRVRKSVGDALASDVGFPEGCALSVCAMGVLDFTLDRWLTALHPTIEVYSFVDDLQILHRAIQCHEQILQELRNFVAAVAMQLDMKKSFAWAIRAADRQVLKTSSLQVVLAARELGAHLNFCKKSGNKTVVDRISAMGPTWTMMRASLSSYRHKVIALKMLAWPRSLHGVSVAPLGPLHLSGLRTGAMKGLRQDRIGSNPSLHLPLSGFTTDPEGYTIWQTIRDAREFSNHDYFRSMLAMWVDNPKVFPQNGPVVILARRLQRIGWEILASGCCQDELGPFDLFTTHVDSLKTRIAIAWGWILTGEVSHRKDFQGIQTADLAAVASIIPRFSDAGQVFLRCSLDGTMVTHKDRHHIDAEHDGSCPFCGLPDGYAHRVWHCDFFKDCRAEFPQDCVVEAMQMPPCSLEHAWPLRPDSFNRLARYLEAIPDLDPKVYRLDKCQHECVDLFTDGTCQYPTMHPIRYAAWAVTVVVSGESWLHNELVAAGAVPGHHQTAYRAELFGLKHALEIASRLPAKLVRIWGDCQSIISTARKLQHLQSTIKSNKSHSDVWESIDRLLQVHGSRIQFQQVYSHNEVASGRTECESWAYWHNALTDAAAAKMVQQRSPAFWEVWNAAHEDFIRLGKLHYEIAALHVRVGRKADRCNKESAPKTRPCATPEVAQRVAQPIRYVQAHSLIRKHGLYIVDLVDRWWQQTGKSFLAQSTTLIWVSFAQLFADFQLSTGAVGPTFKALKWYGNADPFDDGAKPNWGEHARWFQLLLKQYWKTNRLMIDVKSCPPFSGCVMCWMVCAKISWHEKRLDWIDQALQGQLGGALRVGKHLRRMEHLPLDARFGIPTNNGGSG